MDDEVDRVRSVSDGRFSYLRYYMPQLPFYQNIRYRLQNLLMPHMLKLRDEGKLNAAQMKWFRQTKPEEELFDTQAEPFELNNLATDPQYAIKLKELKSVHEKWLKDYKDWGALPEMDMLYQWWKGKDTAPKTSEPVIEYKGSKVTITTKTKGASIAYRKSYNDSWTIYQKPFVWKVGDSLYVAAHRIGYEKSFINTVKN